jgi:hypothetical protein
MRRSSVCSLILMLLFPDQLNVIAMRQRRELSTQAALLTPFRGYWDLGRLSGVPVTRDP